LKSVFVQNLNGYFHKPISSILIGHPIKKYLAVLYARFLEHLHRQP